MHLFFKSSNNYMLSYVLIRITISLCKATDYQRPLSLDVLGVNPGECSLSKWWPKIEMQSMVDLISSYLIGDSQLYYDACVFLGNVRSVEYLAYWRWHSIIIAVLVFARHGSQMKRICGFCWKGFSWDNSKGSSCDLLVVASVCTCNLRRCDSLSK